MDQASADMQTETQKPQNQKYDKNRPKRGNLLMSTGLIVCSMHLFKTCALATLQ
jgi:hypothetical protein